MALAPLLGTRAAQAQTAVAPTSGTGTLSDPYQITELGNLVWMGINVAGEGVTGKYYKLMNDINASDTANWSGGLVPIGSGPGSYSFRATFDGNGKRITGLKINRTTTNFLGPVGLFGYVGSGGAVKNLAVVGGTVRGGEDNVGGLVGDNSGTITNCYATCPVTGINSVGGLIGCNRDGGTITDCYATGAVSGGDSVGGLVGENIYGTIANSCATGKVSGDLPAGGLVGWNDGGTVSNCYAAGAVSGDGYIGGLVGMTIYYGTIANCYATGEVSGDDHVGGLVGSAGGPITNCYATGAVTGTAQVGGLVGFLGSGVVVTNSYWDTQTSGQMGSSGGAGRTTVQMRRQATFVSWDFTSVWSILENVTYPYLSGLRQPPFAPLNVSPVSGAADILPVPTLIASAFNDTNPSDTHAASQWQVRTVVSPSDWSVTVFNSGTTTALTSCAVTVGSLSGGTTYSWHVRYQDNHDMWSAWSTETRFTTDYPPHTPANVSPASGAANVPLVVILASSTFSDPDLGVTHVASQWQVRTGASPSDWSATVLDSGATTATLTNCAVPGGALMWLTDYLWRVRYEDNHGVWSAWSAPTPFTTRPANYPPSFTGAAISPGTAYEASVLSVVCTGWSDADGDAEAYHYQWRRGGTDIPGATSATLTNASFNKGDSIACRVTAWDGKADGNSIVTAAAVIQNTAPSFSSAAITPGTAYEGSTLSVTVGGWADADGDVPAYHYQWQEDGLAVPGAMNATLTGASFKKGDSITCRVTAWDGTDEGNTIITLPVVIENTAPTLASATISPQPAYETSTLSVTCTGWSDADGDPAGYHYQWQRNGTTLTTATSPTLTGACFDKDDTVSCVVTPWDGTAAGVSVMAGPITIRNTPCNVPANQTPANGATNQALSPMLGASPFSDADPGDLHFASQWQVRQIGSPTSYTAVAYDSGLTTEGLTQITLPVVNLLACATSYAWRVRYLDGGGDWSVWSVETGFSTLDAVPAPAEVAASNGSFADRVRIMWTEPVGAADFMVYRSTHLTTATATALMGWMAGTSYDDLTAEPGVIYYYWVVAATNAAGGSASGFGGGDSGWAGAGVAFPSNYRGAILIVH